MGISERQKEIKRRRHRKKKLLKLHGKVKTAKHSDVQLIKEKVRNLTPGSEKVFENWGLDDS